MASVIMICDYNCDADCYDERGDDCDDHGGEDDYGGGDDDVDGDEDDGFREYDEDDQMCSSSRTISNSENNVWYI